MISGADPLDRCPVCKLRPRAQQWFRLDRVAAHFGIHTRTMRRLVASGELAAARFGKPLYISHDGLDAWVKRHSTADEG
jgi:excisionase family DNA binding protein